jgi:hypothetical protein
VDNAVAVTAGLAANASYQDLVTALNRSNYGYSAVDSVVMYHLTLNPAYVQQAVRMIRLYVAAENQRIAAGTNPIMAGDSYLEVGHYLEQLALTYDFAHALLTADERAAWTAFAEQTLFNVWNPSSARWGSRSAPWSGWSIDDPGNNYHFSFLKATQQWALASQNPAWFTFLQTRKYGPLIAYYQLLAGGGSREGTGYGTAHKNLFENHRSWKASSRRGPGGADVAHPRLHRLLAARHRADAGVLCADRRPGPLVAPAHVRLPAPAHAGGDDAERRPAAGGPGRVVAEPCGRERRRQRLRLRTDALQLQLPVRPHGRRSGGAGADGAAVRRLGRGSDLRAQRLDDVRQLARVRGGSRTTSPMRSRSRAVSASSRAPGWR